MTTATKTIITTTAAKAAATMTRVKRSFNFALDYSQERDLIYLIFGFCTLLRCLHFYLFAFSLDRHFCIICGLMRLFVRYSIEFQNCFAILKIRFLFLFFFFLYVLHIYKTYMNGMIQREGEKERKGNHNKIKLNTIYTYTHTAWNSKIISNCSAAFCDSI